MCDRRWKIQLKLGLEIYRPVYRIIHNSVTHFIKLVHLNGRKDFNIQPTEGKRTLSIFFLYLVSALLVCDRYQANNLFLSMPAAALHDRFLWWQQSGPVWEVIEPLTYPHKKKLQRFISGSLVASKTVLGLLQSHVWSSTGANAYLGSCSHQRN